MKKRYAIIALAMVMAVCAILTACSPQEGEANKEPVNTAMTPTGTASSIKLSDNPLTLKAEPVTAKVGEEFSIFVTLEGNADYDVWAAMDLVISYDPNLYSIDDIASTELTSAALIDKSISDNTVKIAVATPQDLTFGQVLELKCTAKAAGTFDAKFTNEAVYIYVIEENNTPNTIPAALQSEGFTVTIED